MKRYLSTFTISSYGGLVAYQRASAGQGLDPADMSSACFFLNCRYDWLRKRSKVYLLFHFEDISV